MGKQMTKEYIIPVYLRPRLLKLSQARYSVKNDRKELLGSLLPKATIYIYTHTYIQPSTAVKK